MIDENITPEEKLLKIIENPQAVGKNKIPLQHRGKPTGGKDIFAWLKKIHIDKDSIKNINLGLVNKAALAGCAAVTVFFLFDFVKFGLQLKARFQGIAAETVVYDKTQKTETIKEANIDDAISMAKGRNIFLFTGGGITEAQTPLMPPDIAQLVSDLKLVGILWSENPQAMIENTKEQKTYLLNKGEQIGQIKIKDIFVDKVVLGKDDKEWELR